jgi:nitrogen-specific signal transduction histidine kinase/CheY-like chemotaxis protein
VWFFRDITARKQQEEQSRRMEEQLRQAQKMDAIGQLAGGVAHDFNNILGAILGCAELALLDLGDHIASHDVREIEAAARRAAGLTRQLLAFSRQQPREISVVSLNDVVTNVETMLSRILGEDIHMSILLAPQLGSIHADSGQIEQVIMNLVVNARDAMPRGGELKVETSNAVLDPPQAARLGIAAGEYVALAVSDSGIGMSPEVQARVFEPFFTTKPVGKGTGLGLSMVFGIIKQNRGAISITSEVSKGSTFRVYLPRLPHETRGANHAKGKIVPAWRPRCILLVEDDDRLRSVISRQLTSWGYTLLEARNGEAALELLQQRREPIELLLTDLVMPGIDGRSLAGKILAERPATKVLFMSGHTEHAALKPGTIGPKDQFISKPFTSDSLSATIRRVLDPPT